MARYTINDIEYPSVTEIIGMLDKSSALMGWVAKSMGEYIIKYQEDYDDLKDLVQKAKYSYKDISAEAMDIGSEIHGLIEIYIKHKIDPTKGKTLHESVSNGYLAFLEWEKENIKEWFYSERPIHDLDIGYAGTLDAIAKMKDNKVIVIDFKSSKGFYDGYDLQISAYRAAAEKIDKIKYDGMGVLRLDKETGLPQYKDYSNIYENKLEAFIKLTDFYYAYKKRRLKNNPRVI
ncbi:MAG: hypothetical protein GWP19_07875 [Planctomycetia bacterium]|nr:hypothetical protein [Planctomycetia bacterium]